MKLPSCSSFFALQELLKNPNFEGEYVGTAQGWDVNYWSGAKFSTSKENNTQQVHSGNSSQIFRVIDKGTGDAHFYQRFSFVNGQTYQASIWFKASSPTFVTFFLRKDVPPYNTFAAKTTKIDSEWQQVTIKGTFLFDGGSIRISLLETNVTLWMDDASLTTIPTSSLTKPLSANPIPKTFFGLHVNQLGTHNSWPDAHQGTIRLWDTITTWKDIEPTQGSFNFSLGGSAFRLQYYINYITKNDPSCKVLYTMGMTPRWASSTPNNSNSYYAVGASGPPTNIADWEEYITTVATRFNNSIHYWEVWNEVDFSGHWTGGINKMIDLARSARKILKAINPNNVIVGPSMTAATGHLWLDSFLANGGAEYVDIINYHWYFGDSPESLEPYFDNIQQLMVSHNVDKPLWNTEGAANIDPLVDNTTQILLTDEGRGAVIARALVLMWAHGISNFNYHVWESHLVNKTDMKTPTLSGIAFREAALWLEGATMTSQETEEDGTRIFVIQRPGKVSRIIWNIKEGEHIISIPSEWGVYNLKDLSGSSKQFNDSSITVNYSPILLEGIESDGSQSVSPSYSDDESTESEAPKLMYSVFLFTCYAFKLGM